MSALKTAQPPPRADVDMDSILVDLMTRVLDRYNTAIAYPMGLRAGELEMITEWDMFKCLPESASIVNIFEEPDFFKDLPPLDGACEGLRQLQALGYDVRIVTSATGHATVPYHKFKWVERHLPGFDMKHVTFAYNKHELTAPYLLIDDGPHNLDRRRDASPSTHLVTIDMPYNKNTIVDWRGMDYKAPALAWGSMVAYATTLKEQGFPLPKRFQLSLAGKA